VKGRRERALTDKPPPRGFLFGWVWASSGSSSKLAGIGTSAGRGRGDSDEWESVHIGSRRRRHGAVLMIGLSARKANATVPSKYIGLDLVLAVVIVVSVCIAGRCNRKPVQHKQRTCSQGYNITPPVPSEY
jgi:hypothetical protein